jgi:uncharacterized membrane protein YoaK (UPF0700 family)
MLLSLAAGAVNAGGLMDCKRFVTHVTGTVTRIGLDVGKWTLMGEYALVLAAFIVGAMTSVLPLQMRTARGLRPVPAVGLAGVTALLIAVSLAGHQGAFGILGGHAEDPEDFGFMAILAFAMGLMNATVASTTALAVRTTHMTGPASDFGVQVALAFLTEGDTRRTALRLAAFRGGTILAFAVGAGLMVPMVHRAGHLAFLVPSLVVFFATARSFLPTSLERPAPALSPETAGSPGRR